MVFECINIRQVPWEVLKTAVLMHEKPCLIPIFKISLQIQGTKSTDGAGCLKFYRRLELMRIYAEIKKKKKKKKNKKYSNVCVKV